VDLTFKDKKLGKAANDDRKLDREYGKIRADKIRTRLSQLRAATTLEDVRNLAGNYHELKGDRKGQWGCDLDQPYRLVFTPHEFPIPTNGDGQYIWIEIKGIALIEIVNYHKEK
jgi:proteic killer suppression protein